MKLAELERHLRRQGCVLYREGAAHTIWINPPLHKIASVPRHREIKDGTGRSGPSASSWKFHSLEAAEAFMYVRFCSKAFLPVSLFTGSASLSFRHPPEKCGRE